MCNDKKHAKKLIADLNTSILENMTMNFHCLGPECVAPKILGQSEEEVCVTEGGNITMNVQCTTSTHTLVKWFKDDQEVQETENVEFTNNNDKYTLTLKNVTIEDDADYSCELSNDLGKDKRWFSVLVEKKKIAPKFTKKLENISVTDGQQIENSVIVQGFPKPTVEWTLNNNKIENGGRYHLKTESENQYTCTIDNVTINDSGMLVCTAMNCEGSVETKLKLSVEGIMFFLNKIVKYSAMRTIYWTLNSPSHSKLLTST